MKKAMIIVIMRLVITKTYINDSDNNSHYHYHQNNVNDIKSN